MSCTFSSLCVDDSPSRVSQSNEELDQNSLCKVSGNEISFYSKQNLPQIQAEKSYEKVAIWLLKHDLCDKKTLKKIKAKQGEDSDMESNDSNVESDNSSNVDSLQKPSEKILKTLKDYTACKPNSTSENTNAKEVNKESNNTPVVNELYYYKSRKLDNTKENTKEIIKEKVLNGISKDRNATSTNEDSMKDHNLSSMNKDIVKESDVSLKQKDIVTDKSKNNKGILKDRDRKVKCKDITKERYVSSKSKEKYARTDVPTDKDKIVKITNDVKERDAKRNSKDLADVKIKDDIKENDLIVKLKVIMAEKDVEAKIKDILKERNLKPRNKDGIKERERGTTPRNIEIEESFIVNDENLPRFDRTEVKIREGKKYNIVNNTDHNVNVQPKYENNTSNNECKKANTSPKTNKKLIRTLKSINAENVQISADVNSKDTKLRIIDDASKAKMLPRSTKALYKTLKRLNSSKQNITDSTNNKNEAKNTRFLLKPSKTRFKLEESSSYLNLGKINLTARSLSQEKIFKVKLDGMFDEYKNPIVKRRNILRHEKLLGNFVKSLKKQPSKPLKKVEIKEITLPAMQGKEIVTIKKAVPNFQSVEKVDNFMNTDPHRDVFTETESTVTTSYLTSYDERSSISKIAVVKGHRRAGSQTIKAIENEYKLKRCVIQRLPCESAFPKLDISVTRVQTEEVLLMTRTTSTTSLENLLNDMELRQLKQNKDLLLQHGLFRGKTKQEARTQVSLHLAFNDLYTLRWINCYLFSTNMLSPYHLIIDDKIRSESEMAIVGSVA